MNRRGRSRDAATADCIALTTENLTSSPRRLRPRRQSPNGGRPVPADQPAAEEDIALIVVPVEFAPPSRSRNSSRHTTPSTVRSSSPRPQPNASPIPSHDRITAAGAVLNNNRKPPPLSTSCTAVIGDDIISTDFDSPVDKRRSNDVELEPASPGSEARDGGVGSGGGVGQHSVGYRLGHRKVLAERRKRIADYSLVFAMFGVAAMIVETELSMAEVYDKVCARLHNCYGP